MQRGQRDDGLRHVNHGRRSRSPDRADRDERERGQMHRWRSCSSERERRSPQRGGPQHDAHASRNYSPDRERGEKRSRSRSHGRISRSRSPPSPSPKKRKKEKRKKDKRKKHHKEKRSKHKKKRRSPSTSSGDNGVHRSPVISPSKHRSRVTVVESPRVDAPEGVSDGSSSNVLAPPPRSYGAKLMAAAEQKRRTDGPNAGKMMSAAERLEKQRAAAQTQQRRSLATTGPPRNDGLSNKSVQSTTEQQGRDQTSARAPTASHAFGNLLPRSVRKSGASATKETFGSSGRMSDRPAFPLKVRRPSSSVASEGLPGPTAPAPVVAKSKRHATTTNVQQQSKQAMQAHAANSSSSGYVSCCECEDQPADVHCMQCDESFCRPCWGGQHRRGKRSLHNLQPILGDLLDRAEQPAEPSAQNEDRDGDTQSHHSDLVHEPAGIVTQDLGAAGSMGPAMPPGGMAQLYSNDSERRLKANRERMKWLPLRLTEEERTLLTLLQGALHHSEYTDKVDVFSHSDKVQRQLHGMKDYMQTQCGLQLANSFKAGQRLVKSKLRVNQDFFARAFEVGRRYKVMNPQKMRSDYGKMMYLLMDSKRPEVAETLQINLVRPIQTVGQLLQAKHGEGILASEDLDDATRDLSDDIHDRSQLLILQQQKREAIDRIVDKYSSKDLSRDEIMRVLDSISDANNFLANNEKPVTRMLELLKTNFDVKGPKGNIKGGDFSLAIGRGNNFRSGGHRHSFYGGHKKFMVHSMGGTNSGGAKLTHSHSTQFTFTSQTFMLWQQVSKHMYSEYPCCCSGLCILCTHNFVTLLISSTALLRRTVDQSRPRHVAKPVSVAEHRAGPQSCAAVSAS